jgi:hypothetical protein
VRVYPVPQHLERRSRIGPFTVPEWAQIAVAAVVAIAVCRFTTLPFSYKGCLVVVIVAPPVVAARLRDVYELGLGHRLTGTLRRLTNPARYEPIVPRRCPGYLRHDEPRRPARRRRGGRDVD